MIDYDALRRVFTYGRVGTGWAGSSPALIFSTMDPEDWDDFKNPATARRLSESPQVREIMGTHYFIRSAVDYSNEHAPAWVFSGEMERVIQALDNQGDLDMIFCVNSEKEFHWLNTKEIMDACVLPQRFAMSCAECLKKSTKASQHDCIVKSLVLEEKNRVNYYRYNPVNLTIPCGALNNIRDDWRHGYSQIEEFVYISPAMTAEHWPSRGMLRKPEDHSFGHIKDRAVERAVNQKERKRFVDFLEQECPRCTIYRECHYAHEEYSWRHCDGPLLWSWNDIADAVLKAMGKPTFNNAQLRYLLAHSGPLDRRYQQCIVSATLQLGYSHALRFCIRRKTKPQPCDDLAAFDNFRDAKKFLDTYGNKNVSTAIAPLTKVRKAILFEALAKQGSPRYRSGWGTISYPIHHIRSVNHGFQQYYSYQSGGRGMIDWNSDYFESLADIYKAFGCFSLFHGTHWKSPLSRKGLKRRLSQK